MNRRRMAYRRAALMLALVMLGMLGWRVLAAERHFVVPEPVAPEALLAFAGTAGAAGSMADIPYVMRGRQNAALADLDSAFEINLADYSAISADADIQIASAGAGEGAGADVGSGNGIGEGSGEGFRERSGEGAGDAANAGTDDLALYWRNDAGWVEWRAQVPATGSYRLEIEYLPLAGSYANIVRGLQIDGEFPFAESSRLVLERHWKDAQFPYSRNEIGQEVRPVQVELGGWRVKAATDYAASSQPLAFALTEGEHTFRLVGHKEPVAIKALRWVPVAPLPDYADYAAEAGMGRGTGSHGHGNQAAGSQSWEGAGQEAQHGGPHGAQPGMSGAQPWFAVIEAEQFRMKSSTAIQTSYIAEPYISPDPQGRMVYNVLGGERWRNPGDWVEWTVEVPEDGWYVLDLKYYQGYRSKFKAYRTLMIDGSVPFREMLQYPLPANENFEIAAVQDAEGVPYRFFLAAGEHTIRLVADASPMQPALLALQHILQEVTELDLAVRKITGNYGKGIGATALNLDPSRTWDLLKYDPQLPGKLERLMGRFTLVADYLDGLSGSRTDMTEAIQAAIDMLVKMAGDVNGIPNRLMDFGTIQNQIGTWLPQLSFQPVLLDYLVVRSPEAATGLKAPSLLSRIPYAALNFARTFYLEYDTRKRNKDQALTVWVQRGRDYVELLREMIDSDFTPRTGIEVNVNLMPNPNQLILGNAAGDQPDVALGVGMEMAVDYAMRDAVADLSEMPGFAEAAQAFNPGAMRSFAYNGGIYALPEVQNFLVLFYRTDLFERLQLEPPNTWEDVYELLPTLQENGLSMYYPPKDFVTFFYQNGAEFYTPDGLANALSTDAALQAFQQWTDLYTHYYLPLEAPAFFNHFRDGDMPIGIADFNTYVQLQVAAPEITGKWKIAPVPGIAQPDGTVARWAAQGLTGAMMMKKSDKQDKAWKFLQWWLSEQVQEQYGNDIESYYGLEFRWNTAHQGAMAALSWPSEDLQAIREQSRWVKNMPYVPGYYFLGRELDFAWNRTVLEGMPPKEALEEAALSLQREMTRRQQDFGIAPGESLHVPTLTEPFEWKEDS